MIFVESHQFIAERALSEWKALIPRSSAPGMTEAKLRNFRAQNILQNNTRSSTAEYFIAAREYPGALLRG